MRIITGFLIPDSGIVTIDGNSVVEKSLLTRQRIGYLPENSPLYGDMEVTSYLSYIADLRGISESEKKARIRDMIHRCGLKDVVGRRIGELSRGFNQRVGLAQALIHEPPILILDEPTSGLDPNQILEIRKLIKEIGRERTVVLSTHILQEVQAVCDRALIINNGELVGEGTLDELMKKGKGDVFYHLTVKAPQDDIEKSVNRLNGLCLHELKKSSDDIWQKVVLSGSHDNDTCEKIFDWVVSNGWKLNELKRETASLEEVFYELTK